MAAQVRNIQGRCHCGNLELELHWPNGSPIPARACGCTFCRKHGGVWTSNPRARLDAVINTLDEVNRYRFGTTTADFFVCRRCGVAPWVISRIGERDYAVVNVNSFEGVASAELDSTPADFGGESRERRLQRRVANWIPTVELKT